MAAHVEGPAASRPQGEVASGQGVAGQPGARSKLSGFVLALCFLSFILYLLNSQAVRYLVAETLRLIQKFLT